MKRVLVVLITIIFVSLQAFGFDLVLPRERKNAVTSNYAFFVGQAKNSESLLINGERIYTAPNGAFAHSVKLKEGENRIVLKSNYKTQIYRFYKSAPKEVVAQELTEFEKPFIATVKKDNTPLRTTPVDAGLNRTAHLFKDTPLVINGSKGSFYRVFLAKNKYTWVAKRDVEVDCEKDFIPAEFITTDSKVYKNARVQTISFSKKLPYTIEENEKELIFSVYNPEHSEQSVYKLNIPKPSKYYYNVTLDDGCYTVKISELPKTSDEITVVVDAGHGGSELGAVGCLGNKEKDINLKIANELKNQLELRGFNVVMTRECDANISLQERIDIAKKTDADIFVSVHLNSIGDIPMNIHKNRGTSVYYYNKNSRKLAESVKQAVTSNAGTRDDGLRTASFAVIRPAHYVGILVETAYMTNPCDSVMYTTEEFIQNSAKGIAEGILNYVQK